MNPRHHRGRGLRITIDRSAFSEVGGGTGRSSAGCGGRSAQYRGRTGLCGAGHGGRSSMNLIPSRIGQANEPIAAAACGSRSTSRFLGGRRRDGWSSRSLGAVPRTYGVGRARNRQLRHKKRGVFRPISAQAFTCRLMSSGFEPRGFPAVPGTYAVVRSECVEFLQWALPQLWMRWAGQGKRTLNPCQAKDLRQVVQIPAGLSTSHGDAFLVFDLLQ